MAVPPGPYATDDWKVHMRTRRALPAVTAAALLLAAAVPAAAQPTDPERLELTLLATTDVHGHVYDWDYFRDQPFPEGSGLGLTRLSTIIGEIRTEKGPESVLLVDNGDTIQGTPLTYYYGIGDGAEAVLDGEVQHPMATAFNYLGYDVQSVGNHEYNYDLPLLAAYERDIDFPLLGANVIDVDTGEPYHQPYALIDREIGDEEVTVGVIGMVTPGVRVWDRSFVEGELEFRDLVETAEQWVPVVAEQADVVVVVTHTGHGTVPDEGYDRSALHENALGNVARMVPGIDVVVAGHSHQDRPEEIVTNTAGEQVLITQPMFWAQSVTETTLNLVPDGDGWAVDWSEGFAPTAVAHYARDAEEDQALRDLLAEEHTATVAYVNTPVAESVTELRADTAHYEDTPIIDFINHVQQSTVEQFLADRGELGDATVVSQASPFSRSAVFPQGEVSIRDIAGLYIYDNWLLGVRLTGAQVRDYLEFSARYYADLEEGEEFDPEVHTNAVRGDRAIPDYAYDVLSGVEYYIDVSQPVGERITGLSYPDGTPVEDDDEFVLAINNYRQSGGQGYPHVVDAEVVYDERVEIRQLLIEWAQERGVIDPADFFVENWWLIDEPLPEPEPTPEPTQEPTTQEPTTQEPTTDPTGDATTPPAGGGPGGGALPSTGAPVGGVVGAAVLAVLAGAAALAQRRRLTM